MTTVLAERPGILPMQQACNALLLNRSTVYARLKRQTTDVKPADRSRKHAPQPRALTDSERQAVRTALGSDRFQDQPPAEVYHRLLQEGQQLCSISTMHRLLRTHGEAGDRRAQRSAQHHAIPRLKAYSPNEVWTWDISKMPLIKRGVYLSLYVVLDLFSRFVVAWMVSKKENSALSRQLMNEAAARYGITRGQLTLHQDRGSPMIANGYLEDMHELDITCSHSRPRVSNDNPFSESQFKTQKYQPDYPGRFESVGHATAWCDDYFQWYNFEHHHSGLAGFTPEQMFTGRYTDVAEQKQRALTARYESHPERFVKGCPKVAMPPSFVAINPVSVEESLEPSSDTVNFPTLSAAGYVKAEKTLTPN